MSAGRPLPPPLVHLQRCIQTQLDECRLQRAFDDAQPAPSVSTSIEWPSAAVKAISPTTTAAAHATCHVLVQLANAFKAKIRAGAASTSAASTVASSLSSSSMSDSASCSSSSSPLSFDVPTALDRWGSLLRSKLLSDPVMQGWSIDVVRGYLNFARTKVDTVEAGAAAAAADASSPSLFAPSTAPAAALPPAPLSLATSFTFTSLGTWRSIFKEKHGTPRQGSVVPLARGSLTLDPAISASSLEGLDEYSHVWLVFVFHENGGAGAPFAAGKIKPPRLGGRKVGVFATRTPHRPNPLGLSLAKLDRVDGSVVHVSGIDLIDGTPIVDIKPYHSADCQQQFTVPSWMAAAPEKSLDVAWAPGTLAQLDRFVSGAAHGLEFYARSEVSAVRRLIESILEQDPRTLHSKEKHAQGGVYGICVDRIDVAFKIIQQNEGQAAGAGTMEMAEPAAAAGSSSSAAAGPASSASSTSAAAGASAPRLVALIFDLEYFAPHADRPRQRTKEWLERITGKSNAATATGEAAAAPADSAVSPPAARLVGIELNPGPPKRSAASAATASSSSAAPVCAHAHLVTEPSAHAREVGYVRPSAEERRAATIISESNKSSKLKPKGKRSRTEPEGTTSASAAAAAAASTATSLPVDPLRYPAPLCLPGDDLALDPDCPLQPLSEWLADGDRNEVNSAHRTIYVVAPPKLERAYLRSWCEPRVSAATADQSAISPPKIADVVAYLAAFYSGMSVKQLPALTLTAWDASDDDEQTGEDAAGASSAAAAPSSRPSKASAAKAGPRYVALNSATEGVRIRTRASLDGLFDRQLNLDDLLDAAIGLLPRDAYALLLLVDHDLYESKDDLFCCGRAYGGSRVAVISSARYHPAIDAIQQVEREHAWPAAHCARYVRANEQDQADAGNKKKKAKVKAGTAAAAAAASSDSADGTAAASSSAAASASPSPLSLAIAAHSAVSPSAASASAAAFLSGLWLGRVCRTSAHELGHCFGIEHCTAYACAMQGSANISEDARQPPYLCPIDDAKLTHATGADTSTRSRALLRFCEQHAQVQLFAAFAAWIRASLAVPLVAMSQLGAKTAE